MLRIAKGIVQVSTVIIVLALCGMVGVQAIAAHAVAHRTMRFTEYLVAVNEQFINNNDDEARGDINNPFGVHNSEAASVSEAHSNGPYAGDEASFSFRLYRTADLKTQIGTATFGCVYYVRKEGYCDAAFVLPGRGSLYGAGSFSFNAEQFALGITGGTGAFRGWTGDAEAVGGKRDSELLKFVLALS